MRAAGAVGPASRPLLLFYGLSQAGRAIVAARSDAIEVHESHGLTLERPVSSGVLGVVLVPKSKGQFPALAGAVGSPGLSTSVQLGGLMAAIPELAHLPQLGDNWRRALPVWPSAPDPVWSKSASSGIGATTRKVPVVVVFPEPQPSSVEELRQALGLYPVACQVDPSGPSWK